MDRMSDYSARAIFSRHCEERRDEAISTSELGDCFAAKSAARNDRLSNYQDETHKNPVNPVNPVCLPLRQSASGLLTK